MPNILEETQQILFTGHKTGFFCFLCTISYAEDRERLCTVNVY